MKWKLHYRVSLETFERRAHAARGGALIPVICLIENCCLSRLILPPACPLEGRQYLFRFKSWCATLRPHTYTSSQSFREKDELPVHFFLANEHTWPPQFQLLSRLRNWPPGRQCSRPQSNCVCRDDDEVVQIVICHFFSFHIALVSAGT